MPFALPVLFVDPVLGAAAVALIIAGVLLAKMLGSLIGSISVGPISIDPGAWFRSIANSIESWAVSAFDSIIAPVGNWLNGLAFDAYHTLSDVVTGITHLGDQVAHLATSTIPQAIAAETSSLARTISRDISAVDTKIVNAVAGVKGDITTAIDHQFAHIMGIVDSDIGALHTFVDNAVTGAEQLASSALSTVERTLTGDISSAIQTAEAAAAAADAALTRDLDGAIAAGEAAAASAAGVLQGEISAAGANLATVAATAAAALAVATTVAREFDSCAVTSCAGPNNLGNLLNQLLGVISYADLAAFIGLAIGQPGAAAGEFAPAARGLYSSADQLLGTLLAL